MGETLDVADRLVLMVSDDGRVRFRIGMHLGEVIEKPDGTVYGDGVNNAARLQDPAAPAAITVSEAAAPPGGARAPPWTTVKA